MPDIDSLKHKDTRVNIPTRELDDFVADDEVNPKVVEYPGLLYARDPSLDPRLVYRGKDAQDREKPAVVNYVKNHYLGIAIPYTINGEEYQYLLDFIVCLDDSHDPGDLLNLIVEVTGEKRKDKAAKVATARVLYVPAMNNHEGFGQWELIEIIDLWNSQKLFVNIGVIQ